VDIMPVVGPSSFWLVALVTLLAVDLWSRRRPPL
jgi:hypothetical protein